MAASVRSSTSLAPVAGATIALDDIPDHARDVEDVPPDGGYGWVCTAAVFMLNACAWGINSAFGVFLAHYLANDTFPGTTPFSFAFIGGLSISQALLTSPVIQITTKMWGLRVTLAIGIVLSALAMVGASFAKDFWQLLLTQGICFGWGMGFLYIGSLGVIPQWFTTHRSLAMGIAASGAGVGGLAYNLLANALIESVGLPWTFRILAASAFFINAISTMALRDRSKFVQPKHTALDFRLLARPEILLIVGWGFLSELGYIVLYYSMPNYAASIGLSAQQGSVVGAMLSLGLAVGRPIIGHYSDRVGRINMAMFMTAFCGILCFVVWVFAKSFGVLIFFALIAGSVCGTFWSTVAPVGAEIVGLKDLSSALSVTWILLVFPCTFAEPIAVQLVGSSSGGSAWLRPQLFVGFMFIGAAMCTLSLRSWKIIEIEKKRERETGYSYWPTSSSSWAESLRYLRAAFILQKV